MSPSNWDFKSNLSDKGSPINELAVAPVILTGINRPRRFAGHLTLTIRLPRVRPIICPIFQLRLTVEQNLFQISDSLTIPV